MLRKYPFLNKLHSFTHASTGHPSHPNISLPTCTSVVTSSFDSRAALDSQSSNSSSSHTAPSGTAAETKALDVASLLAATHSWVSENSVEGIAASILRVLLQNTGASYGCFAYKDERGLRLRAAGSVDTMQVSHSGPQNDEYFSMSRRAT
jgi:hypothetical protein